MRCDDSSANGDSLVEEERPLLCCTLCFQRLGHEGGATTFRLVRMGSLMRRSLLLLTSLTHSFLRSLDLEWLLECMVAWQ